VQLGAHRDSAHEAVTGTPAAWWSTTPLAASVLDPKLYNYLQVYADGPQVT
jgi:hypothetical protein